MLKRFLVKATSQNDHYMINMTGQRPCSAELLIFTCTIRATLCCKVLKVFKFTFFSSF